MLRTAQSSAVSRARRNRRSCEGIALVAHLREQSGADSWKLAMDSELDCLLPMTQAVAELTSGRLLPRSGRPAEQPGAFVGREADSQQGTEMSMVRRMVAGDDEAFERFADFYIPRLHRFALHRLNRDQELTREIVQATVVKAIAKLETFRGEAALMTWLCACCRAEIAGHFRRERRGGYEVELDEDLAPFRAEWSPEPPGGPEVDVLKGETSHLVHEALDLLPAHYGRALEWKYLDELPVKEIAARLKVKPKAAESLLTRARDAFRGTYARLAVRTTG